VVGHPAPSAATAEGETEAEADTEPDPCRQPDGFDYPAGMTESARVEVGCEGRPAPGPRPWHVPMTGRDPAEEHRASTPLELLYDLCFVIAVGQAGRELHHDLAVGAVGHATVGFLFVWSSRPAWPTAMTKHRS
jgi:hypothetical protein